MTAEKPIRPADTGWASRPSSSSQHVVDDLALADRDEGPMQDAFRVFATGIDAQGAAQLRCATRFVNMTVQREQWLIPLYRGAHRRRADRRHHHACGPHCRTQLGIEERR